MIFGWKIDNLKMTFLSKNPIVFHEYPWRYFLCYWYWYFSSSRGSSRRTSDARLSTEGLFSPVREVESKRNSLATPSASPYLSSIQEEGTGTGAGALDIGASPVTISRNRGEFFVIHMISMNGKIWMAIQFSFYLSLTSKRSPCLARMRYFSVNIPEYWKSWSIPLNAPL